MRSREEHLPSKEARVKRGVAWRYAVSALLGVYLLLSPWILGTVDGVASTLSAGAVGLCLLTLAARGLVTGGSWATETIRLALGGWLVIAPFALSFSSPVATRNSWIVGALVMALVNVAGTVSAMDTLLRTKSRSYRALRLSPEKIASWETSEEPVTPEILSRRIVERSEQIRKTLVNTDLEIEVEMCILGYRSCTADMLLLLGLLEKELPRAHPLQRWRLKVARRKATTSLSKIRKVLPPETVDALHPGER